MSYSIKETLLWIQGLLAPLSSLSVVQIGEPKSPPLDKTVAMFLMELTQPETDLGGSIELYQIRLRVYYNAMHEPIEDIEFDTQQAVADILEALANNYTLNGNIRAIDFAGEEGGHLTVKWGHLDVSGTLYRAADIDLHLIVDDSATWGA